MAFGLSVPNKASAIILAAGLSSRMGRLKPLLPLGTGTVLGQCIAVLKQAGVSDILVVAGHRSEEVAAEVCVHGARPVHNPDFLEGMYSSIVAGVRMLDPNLATVLLLPVDIPLIRVGTVLLLQEAMQARGAQVAHPVFAGERGHPLCIRATLLRQLTQGEKGQAGLRPLLANHEQKHPKQVCEVRVADANILVDLDTPEAYKQGCERFGHRDYPAPEEAEVIVRYIHPMPAKGIVHGRLVGELAALFATAINRQQESGLNVELCRTCGLLHDLAKGQPHHEATGGLWLTRLGFPKAAAIVAAHKDLDWQTGGAITERELVHLADKLARGGYLLSIDRRFTEKKILYAHDAEAQAAIRDRHALARRLAQAVEEESGQELSALCRPLAHLQLPC
ncbi:MAG: NTP transferase domain-containing protein [Desulfobulbaceae bacterium]|nr:NTP transferase domain-containing protein [Desulfobulbaceae bacterium]